MIEDLDLLADSQDGPQSAPVPDSPALKNVSALVAEWEDRTGTIKRLAERMAELAARVQEIEQQALPLAMTEVGLTSFVTANGRTVKVESVVRGNIPALSTVEKAKGDLRRALEARRTTAIDFVRKTWPGLIKTEVSVSLGRGQAEVAPRIAALLREQFQLSPSVDETIHPATLNSHFGELMANGKLEDIPVEPFALYVGPIAKIK